MANPPKRKGTGGETELRRLLEALFDRPFRRTAPGSAWDLEAEGHVTDPPICVLATRPDNGRWLVSMTPEGWLGDPFAAEIRVEVKRYARFAHHMIYESKFGRL
jgi:hypothetical protein